MNVPRYLLLTSLLTFGIATFGLALALRLWFLAVVLSFPIFVLAQHIWTSDWLAVQFGRKSMPNISFSETIRYRSKAQRITVGLFLTGVLASWRIIEGGFLTAVIVGPAMIVGMAWLVVVIQKEGWSR